MTNEADPLLTEDDAGAPLRWARAGAFFYVVWGMLHYLAAWRVWQLGTGLPEGMVQGRVLQDAWHLALISTLAIWVAVTMNWRNGRFGFWLNGLVVSLTDIGFILLVVLPGYMPVPAALVGPSVWLLAFTASTVGRRLVWPAPVAPSGAARKR